jgi:hypothetical protein
MGGLGSGRHGSSLAAATCESCHSVDLAWLRRRPSRVTAAPWRHRQLALHRTVNVEGLASPNCIYWSRFIHWYFVCAVCIYFRTGSTALG